MKKHMAMVGLMIAGAAVVGKRAYDILKLRKTEEQKEIIEIEVETKPEQ